MPFLNDFAVHARFLFAVPILLSAETILGPRLAEAARHFVISGVVVEQDFSRFDNGCSTRARLARLNASRGHLRVFAYAVTVVNLRLTAVHVSNWAALRD